MSTSIPEYGQPRKAGKHHLVVGTFSHPSLHVLTLDTRLRERVLSVTANLAANGKHSWLALDAFRDRVYATSWTQNDADPSVVGYQIRRGNDERHWEAVSLGSQIIASRSGYVALGPNITASQPANVLYSVGGPSGEVFALHPDTGDFGSSDGLPAISNVPQSEARVQEIDFLHGGRISRPGKRLTQAERANDQNDKGEHSGVLAFGGLRHGSHSIDVGPPSATTNGELLRPVYVADIGRNSTFVYTADESGALQLACRVQAPEENDGPRHAWAHPNGKVVYVVEEHSNVIDVYRVKWHEDSGESNHDGYEGETRRLTLSHAQRLSILPPDEPAKKFWADEVRLSPVQTNGGHDYPRWLFGSTRGLEADTKGYVALFELDERGYVLGAERGAATQHQAYTDIYQTPTSGGWANAIEPCPWIIEDGGSGVYAVLTDSEEGLIVALTIDIEEEVQDAASDRGHVSVTGQVSGSVSGHVEGSLTSHVDGNTSLDGIVDNRLRNNVRTDDVDNEITKDVVHHNRRAVAKLIEVARTSLGTAATDGKIRGAATAVWLA